MSIAEADPGRLADQIVAAHREEPGWLADFAVQFERRHAGTSLARLLAIWDLSQSDAARLFGVTRQAVGKWLVAGAPAARADQLSELSAATDLLVRNLKRDRIPAVVRRRSAALGGMSLIELLEHDGPRAVLDACRSMFEFDRTHG